MEKVQHPIQISQMLFLFVPTLILHFSFHFLFFFSLVKKKSNNKTKQNGAAGRGAHPYHSSSRKKQQNISFLNRSPALLLPKFIRPFVYSFFPSFSSLSRAFIQQEEKKKRKIVLHLCEMK
ncbi:hypothetical protein, unlikely [Trypanosoma brucei gambiense DAL972]|uniref:Uncharacterized protein n=1 Tax=Trypanosoma brucei gambiense (strain MHOM/CI/86/DAL972) TaxID=679716 RepID=D0A138_TRYB9|nr:hypothetical protein, unlikely [Trypanosoma brucei gambiense DAL972]CBH14980.1 hypothetical protein, unlikely [Trypanosoma brucei gambiense DAL972]|eukprot:XP_011777246.1 hypothetical protein, unlikely [Trypanosoma brucei gambiense DAL972]